MRRFLRASLASHGLSAGRGGDAARRGCVEAASAPARPRPARPRAARPATASRSSARLREWTPRADHRALGARPGGRQGRGARRRRRRLPHQAVRRGELLARMRVALRHARARRPSGRRAGVRGRRPPGRPGRAPGAASAARRSTSRRSSTGCSPTLVQHAGKVLTHRQLLKEVWGPAYATRPTTCASTWRQLRRKLEADPARPRYLSPSRRRLPARRRLIRVAKQPAWSARDLTARIARSRAAPRTLRRIPSTAGYDGRPAAGPRRAGRVEGEDASGAARTRSTYFGSSSKNSEQTISSSLASKMTRSSSRNCA